MDALLAEVNDFLAWEGSQGASLPKLWVHVATTFFSPAQGSLPAATKQALWQLLAVHPEYRLFCHERHEGVTQASTEPVDGVTLPASLQINQPSIATSQPANQPTFLTI
jgi:hypothetical protein